MQAHVNRLYSSVFKKKEMIEKLTQKVQKDRGITFQPQINDYRPPSHTQSLKRVIENNQGDAFESIDSLDPISQPYYPALNTIDYYTKWDSWLMDESLFKIQN